MPAWWRLDRWMVRLGAWFANEKMSLVPFTRIAFSKGGARVETVMVDAFYLRPTGSFP